MRRGAVVVAVLLMVLITGCRSSKTAEPVGSGFSCRIQADYKDMDVEGTLVRQTAGMLKITFSAPETLAGTTALWDGETVVLEMGGMSFSVDPSTVPESALGEEIVAVLDAAIRGEGDRHEEDGKLIISGSGSNGKYELACDAKTGVPVSLSVPAIPLFATFSEFKIDP